MPVSRLLSRLLGTLLLCTLPWAAALALPDTAAITRQLDALPADSTQPDVVRERTWLTDTLNALARQQAATEASQALARQAEQAGRTLNRWSSAPDVDPVPAEEPSPTVIDVQGLSDRLTRHLQQQQEAEARLQQALDDVTRLQLAPDRAQQQMQRALAAQEALRQEQLSLASQMDHPAAAQRFEALAAALDAELELAQKTLEVNATLLSLATLERDRARRQVAALEQDTEALQQQLDQLRDAEALAQLQDLQEQLAQLPQHSLLAEESERNDALAARLLEVTRQTSLQQQINQRLSDQLSQLHQMDRTITEQVSTLNGGLLLSRLLYQQQRQLPQPDPSQLQNLDVNALRLEQYQVQEQRQALRDPDALLTRIQSHQDVTLSPEELSMLRQLQEVRQHLLSQLDPALAQLLTLSIRGQSDYQRLIRTSRATRHRLQENLLWMPSARPLSLQVLKQMPANLSQQVQDMVDSPYWDQILRRLRNAWGLALPVLFTALGLVLLSGRHRRQIRDMKQRVGILSQDSQWFTPRTLLLLALNTAVLPLVLAAGAVVFLSGDTLGAQLAGGLLRDLALLLWVSLFWWKLFAPDGIAIRHFRFPEHATARLRLGMVRVTLLLLPLVIQVVFGRISPESFTENGLGMATLILTAPLLSLALWHFVQAWPFQPQTRFRRQALQVLSLTPLALGLLAACGFYYTALRLADLGVTTFYLLLAWLLAVVTTRRALLLAARRMAWRHALARREEIKAQRAAQEEGSESDLPDIIEEPPRDLAQVNAQSLRLNSLFIGIGFGLLLWWLWIDVISSFTYFNNITLWQHVVGEGASATTVGTSLGDLLLALLILVVTGVLSRNLPGLLEILLLSRLDLPHGTRYAATSLLTYTIVSIGLVLFLATLGIAWSQLQWLVAALGVGLGFGLQEIFANFVSGLILLFERPIRVGDQITIGGVDGTVARIRIRATTLRDADGKDVIIPNRSFITGQLTNWSLPDTTTRVVIPVGFAYGTDLELARQTLLQAATEHPRVLKEPAPSVYFLTFGASSLDHELRFHVREIGDRTPTRDQIARRIDALCRERDLEMPFNQLDVFIKNPPNSSSSSG